MKKQILYFDTSVISHLDHPDVPDKEADTKTLWQLCKEGIYTVCISAVVLNELQRCFEPKRSYLVQQIHDLNCTVLEETEEVLDLADRYVQAGILKNKNYDDCRHIAFACVYQSDMIVSWNFKHLVNVRTIAGVRSINAIAGYREMPIYSPTMLIQGRE